MVEKILYWEQKSQVITFEINATFPQTLKINEFQQTSKGKGVPQNSLQFLFPKDLHVLSSPTFTLVYCLIYPKFIYPLYYLYTRDGL